RQGAGLAGIGVTVVEGAGAASFDAISNAQGAARLGVGVLAIDSVTNTTFRARSNSQGAGDLGGVGILWNSGRHDVADAYASDARSQAYGSLGSGILYDGGGDASFRAANRSQAYARTGGLALLRNGAG